MSIIIGIPLAEYINNNYKGVKSHFASDFGLQKQNVNTLLKANCIVIDNEIYRPMGKRG